MRLNVFTHAFGAHAFRILELWGNHFIIHIIYLHPSIVIAIYTYHSVYMQRTNTTEPCSSPIIYTSNVRLHIYMEMCSWSTVKIERCNGYGE